jgi:hypothetical protein
MARPPNAPNSPKTWQPPASAGGVVLRHQPTHKVRQYLLPVPAVPQVIAKVIRSSAVTQPFAAQQHKIRILTQKLHDQRQKVAASREKIALLEERKEHGLRDIRETRQAETANTLAALERKMRNRLQKEKAVAEAAWKERTELESELKRQALRERFEARDLSDDVSAPAVKRRKVLLGDDNDEHGHRHDKEEGEKEVVEEEERTAEHMVLPLAMPVRCSRN